MIKYRQYLLEKYQIVFLSDIYLKFTNINLWIFTIRFLNHTFDVSSELSSISHSFVLSLYLNSIFIIILTFDEFVFYFVKFYYYLTSFAFIQLIVEDADIFSTIYGYKAIEQVIVFQICVSCIEQIPYFQNNFTLISHLYIKPLFK